MIDMTVVAENIEKSAMNRHLSLNEVCRRTGTSFNQIVRLRQGKTMTLDLLDRFAKTLRVKPTTLLRGAEK